MARSFLKARYAPRLRYYWGFSDSKEVLETPLGSSGDNAARKVLRDWKE